MFGAQWLLCHLTLTRVTRPGDTTAWVHNKRLAGVAGAGGCVVVAVVGAPSLTFRGRQQQQQHAEMKLVVLCVAKRHGSDGKVYTEQLGACFNGVSVEGSPGLYRMCPGGC